jgi:hypothetical protein
MNLRRFFRTLSDIELVGDGQFYNADYWRAMHATVRVRTLTLRGFRTERRPIASTGPRNGTEEWRFADTGERIEPKPMEALLFAAKARRHLALGVGVRLDGATAAPNVYKSPQPGTTVGSVFASAGGSVGVSVRNLNEFNSQATRTFHP